VGEKIPPPKCTAFSGIERDRKNIEAKIGTYLSQGELTAVNITMF